MQGKNLAGKVALVRRGEMRLSEKAANAAMAAAAGVIIYNNEPGPFYGALLDSNRLPALSISDKDGRYLLSPLRRGPVAVRVKVDASTAERQSVNVVAQGPHRAAKAISLGAHYDSVGPGVNDNASGVAVVLQLARILAARGQADRVVVVAFAGEEEGLVGSRAYVAGLGQDGRSYLAAMLNFDMVGAGTVIEVASGGSPEAERYARTAVALAAAAGTPTKAGGAGRDGDHWPFVEKVVREKLKQE